ncbi:hypothetical protein [Lacibacter sp. H407]|uniref:hypothetical protein n=1 Tax=Lacibacter sp. H407 TaxID=3133423 RepID=UPI0030BB7934
MFGRLCYAADILFKQFYDENNNCFINDHIGWSDAGIRLFDQIGIHQIELKKTNVIYTAGATHIQYEIAK